MGFRFLLVAFIQLGLLCQVNSRLEPSLYDSKEEFIDEKINCFVYHRFGDDRYPSTNISLESFENHLRFLKENEYNVLTLKEAVRLLLGDENIPPKTVVLTVDDGYKSFITGGMPLLSKYGFKATVFINTIQVGYPDFLSWEEIQFLVGEGIEIGNHSHSHDYFANYQGSELIESFNNDLEISQELFVSNLGFAPEVYSYPYGEYTNKIKAELNKFGIKAAVGQNSGVISTISDIYALPRFPMTGNSSNLEKFIQKVNMRALPVKPVQVYDPIVRNSNPPELIVQLLNPELIQTANLQCFVGGKRECQMSYNMEKSLITVQSINTLVSRRTLYTITAPSAKQSNVWYWYSWLWVIPEIK